MANNVPSLSTDSQMRQRELSRGGAHAPGQFSPPELTASGGSNITGQELDVLMQTLGGATGPKLQAFQARLPKRANTGKLNMSEELIQFFQMLGQLRRR